MSQTETVVISTTEKIPSRSHDTPSIGDLRKAIPPKCFERSAITSVSYIIRDVCCVTAMFIAASKLIPQIEDTFLRLITWNIYGFVQGLFFTGVWILAHECGHSALFNNDIVNNTFGFILHSFLLVPYFSWKYSHALHHRYHNNMSKDTAFVPPREGDFRPIEWVHKVLDAGEDAPIVGLLFLIGHQIIGWPAYLFFNITAGPGSLSSEKKSWSIDSHFDPRASLWTDPQRRSILISDFGILMTLFALWKWSQVTSIGHICLLYGLPYLWVNHWLVAITYLHHTHPSAVHYENEAWSFRDGALSTVDRDFGFIGKEIMHGIIEYHVIHHFFTKIPFYHAEEATEAIKPLLGRSYLSDSTPMWQALWQTFNGLKYVRPQDQNSNILVWEGKVR